jgi:hypothetical protein
MNIMITTIQTYKQNNNIIKQTITITIINMIINKITAMKITKIIL